MKSSENIKERFLNDIKNHSMEVLLDNGVYRHLKFSNGGSSCYRFDLITFPGHLLITGDMGDILFERVPDMFNFFRKEKINPGYWSEKIEASDGDVTEFDFDSFKEQVNEYVQNFIEEEVEDEDDAETLRDDIKWMVLGQVEDSNSMDEAYRALNDYHDSALGFRFVDTFEWSFKQYTFHYLWKLHAIVWGIAEYDKFKDEPYFGMQ